MDIGFQVPSDTGRPFPLSMSGELIELGKALFVAYWMVLQSPEQ